MECIYTYIRYIHLDFLYFSYFRRWELSLEHKCFISEESNAYKIAR